MTPVPEPSSLALLTVGGLGGNIPELIRKRLIHIPADVVRSPSDFLLRNAWIDAGQTGKHQRTCVSEAIPTATIALINKTDEANVTPNIANACACGSAVTFPGFNIFCRFPTFYWNDANMPDNLCLAIGRSRAAGLTGRASQSSNSHRGSL